MNNLKFLKEFKENQKKYFSQDNYKNVEDKFINGCCIQLVYHLMNLNKNTGKSLRLNQDLGNGNSIIHFVYQSNDGKYYDINGSFSSVKEIAIASGLFKDLNKLCVDIDFEKPCKEDFLEGELDEVNKIIQDLNSTTSCKIIKTIKEFKNANGRFWKSKLKKIWSSGNYQGIDKKDICYLQQARNKDINLNKI